MCLRYERRCEIGYLDHEIFVQKIEEKLDVIINDDDIIANKDLNFHNHILIRSAIDWSNLIRKKKEFKIMGRFLGLDIIKRYLNKRRKL